VSKVVDENNPIGYIKDKLREILKNAIRTSYPSHVDRVELVYPPSRAYGDLSSLIAFQIAYDLYEDKSEAQKKVDEIATRIFKALKWDDEPLISNIEVVNGYINVFLNYATFSAFTLKTILSLNDKYGFNNIGNGRKVIVEHTSANPIHPLHIGTARNAILGDSLARIFRALGYNTETRFYVNDMGRQVANLIYGYSKIHNKLNVEGKPDHWFGIIYSITSGIIEVLKNIKKLSDLKKSFNRKLDEIAMIIGKASIDNLILFELTKLLKRFKTLETIDWLKYVSEMIKKIDQLNDEKIENEIKSIIGNELNELKEVISKVKEWLHVTSEMALKWPNYYDLLLREILHDEDPEEEISELMRKYESKDPKIVMLFRDVCERVLEGFNKTLEYVNIKFDKFDWESDLVWNGYVENVLKELTKSGWTIIDDTGALYLNIREALRNMKKIRELFNITEEIIEKACLEGKEDEFLPPNLVLKRSDGTTLYTTRDIAYSLYKIREGKADNVYNVIGKDQTLPQKQLKAALILAGYEDIADKLYHVAYELVIIPGAKLSARRGRYITFDEILMEAEDRAYKEVTIRQQDLSEKMRRTIAKHVAAGAVRYALISTAPEKPIVFDWSKVLDFERNSGPFLQYAYARAVSILRKANWELPDANEVSYDVLKEDVEKELIFQLARLPEVIYDAGIKLRPDIIAEYANKLAMIFNSFYQRFPVLRAPTEELKKARLLLVEAFRITFKNTLNLLGITPLEKM